LPSDRIAVPACYRCNNDASKDDGVFRDELSIMAGSFGGSANAAERLQVTLRGLRRKEATARCARMLKSAQLVERRTPSGLFLGYGYAMPVAPGVQQRVIARIVRGLYWHHTQTRLGQDAQISIVFIDKGKPHWQEALQPLLRLAHVLIGDGQTFQYYGGMNIKERPGFSAWLMIFFRGSSEQIVYARTLPAGMTDPLVRGAARVLWPNDITADKPGSGGPDPLSGNSVARGDYETSAPSAGARREQPSDDAARSHRR